MRQNIARIVLMLPTMTRCQLSSGLLRHIHRAMSVTIAFYILQAQVAPLVREDPLEQEAHQEQEVR